jgi:hypothetical protein
MLYEASAAGKYTDRNRRVASRLRLVRAIAARPAASRDRCSRKASMVRAPAVVAASSSASSELAAPSSRYALRARRRYQRPVTTMPDSPSSPATPSSGSSTRIIGGMRVDGS